LICCILYLLKDIKEETKRDNLRQGKGDRNICLALWIFSLNLTSWGTPFLGQNMTYSLVVTLTYNFHFDFPKFDPTVSGFSVSGPNRWLHCRSVCVAAGSAALAALPLCLESRSTHCVFQSIPINIGLLFILVKEGAGEF
jgi:hypothetical protein